MSPTQETEQLKPPYGIDKNSRDEYKDYQEDEEEEEALSLCDLPVTNRAPKEEGKEEGYHTANDSDFDFDFGSLIGSVPALESEMCAADEVFSGGQMLPFRHSVSCEVGLSGPRVPMTRRSVSRSDSMDRAGLGSRSTSSRSSSTRSQHSASSSTSSGSASSAVTIPRPTKGRNHFHSYPSPKPQVRASSGTRNANWAGSKSTMWQVLRLGLVRTPEIELQDLKARNKTTTNFQRLHAYKVVKKQSEKIGDLLEGTHKRESQISKDGNKNGGGFLGNCKCSVGAIEPIIIPTSRSSIRPNYGAKTGTKITTAGERNRSLGQFVPLTEDNDLAQHKKQQEDEKKQVRQGKRVGSHHRTFDWLIRDLSHASVLNS